VAFWGGGAQCRIRLGRLLDRVQEHVPVALTQPLLLLPSYNGLGSFEGVGQHELAHRRMRVGGGTLEDALAPGIQAQVQAIPLAHRFSRHGWIPPAYMR
jgi:hypothetical protein